MWERPAGEGLSDTYYDVHRVRKEPVGIPGKRIPRQRKQLAQSLGPQSRLNVVITLATYRNFLGVGFHPERVCVKH